MAAAGLKHDLVISENTQSSVMYSHPIIPSSGEYVNKKVAAHPRIVLEYGMPVHSAWPFPVNVNLNLHK